MKHVAALLACLPPTSALLPPCPPLAHTHAHTRPLPPYTLTHPQIEHHLFPGISQYYYPALAPLVVSTCQEFGIPYRYERNFFTAFSAHLTYLKEMGAKGRPHKMD